MANLFFHIASAKCAGFFCLSGNRNANARQRDVTVCTQCPMTKRAMWTACSLNRCRPLHQPSRARPVTGSSLPLGRRRRRPPMPGRAHRSASSARSLSSVCSRECCRCAVQPAPVQHSIRLPGRSISHDIPLPHQPTDGDDVEEHRQSLIDGGRSQRRDWCLWARRPKLRSGAVCHRRAGQLCDRTHVYPKLVDTLDKTIFLALAGGAFG